MVMAKFCGKCGAKLNEMTGRCPNCDKIGGNKPKKKRFLKLFLFWTIIVILVVATVVLGLTYHNMSNINPTQNLINNIRVGSDDVLKYDNGDFIYVPDDKFIKCDEKTFDVYYDNLLTVYTYEDLTEFGAQELAELVDGKIVGDISGTINVLQILVDEGTLSELEEKSAKLMEKSTVMYAQIAFPVEMTDSVADSNPWGKTIRDLDRGNENSPKGNDWWAEAIGAYTAWKYDDRAGTIDVGVLDNGFDEGHEDLQDKINFIDNYKKNGKADHGTHVSGIIAANNNNVGIRGVADKSNLLCIDYEEYGQDIEHLEMTKQLVDNGAKVINNSWGAYFLSKAGYIKNCLDKSEYNPINYLVVDKTGAYESYLKYREAFAKRTAMQEIAMIVQMILNQKEFLIVKAAGNGYDNAGPGINTDKEGYYCSIDEELYNLLSESTINRLAEMGITFQSIDKRILVVGAIKNSKDQNGHYEMTNFSDFGNNVDICAPGEEIFSTGMDEKYFNDSGTSMAAPMVTGAAAYIWSLAPDLTAEEIWSNIIDNAPKNAVGVNDDKGTLYPMLNVGKAAEDVINSLGEQPAYNDTYKTTSNERNIVLTLDVSGSMSGTPLEETKKASSKFINTVFEKGAAIGIVDYDDSAEIASDFSTDKNYLQSVVSELSGGGGTNIEDGLREASNLLNNSNAKKKIVVLMSDGKPNEGLEGEDLIAYADEIKNQGVLIYTLGFFESLSNNKSSAQILMEKIASEGCHYEVANADDLVFFFEDMADQINGQKYIYVRIACPIDVTVTSNGETLCSSDSDLNLRTDFGTLTFEDNDEQQLSENQDNRVKVLRLKEGIDYDLSLSGTGRGTMNYTIGFMNDDGDYSDLRKFENIRITKATQIDTVAGVSSESVLNIDEDGDGKYDKKLRAKENGYGEEIKTPKWIYAAIGLAFALIFVDIIIIKIRKKRKEKI